MLLYYTVTPKLCSWNLRFTKHEADYKKCKTVPTKFIRVQNSFAYLFYVSFFSAIEFNSQSLSLVLRVLLSMKWIEVYHISNKHNFDIVCDTCMISQCLTSYHNTFIVNIEPTCMYSIYCDIVDIAVFGDIVSALCQYRHRGNIVPIFPFTLLISSISPKCYRRTWNQYPLYHQCYLKMIRYGIWSHKLLYVFKKIAKYCDIVLYYTVYRALQFIVGKVYMYTCTSQNGPRPSLIQIHVQCTFEVDYVWIISLSTETLRI